MPLSEVAQAQIAGYAVRRARLVWFEFASGDIGLWNGFRTLTTSDGRTWMGAHGLGRVEGVRQSINGQAPPIRLTLSGVNAVFAAKAHADRADYRDRRVLLLNQWFAGNRELAPGDDPAAVLQMWAPVGDPIVDLWGLMKGFVYEKTRVKDGWLRTVTLSAETVFGDKATAPGGVCTDTDQKKDYPDDEIYNRVAINESRNIEFYPV
jgi:hypothetical protein